MRKRGVRGKAAPPAVKAARAGARAAGWGGAAVSAPADVVLGYAAPDNERLAASTWVRGHEWDADGWDAEHGPFWLGWCPHAAFLAGIAWGKAHAGEGE